MFYLFHICYTWHKGKQGLKNTIYYMYKSLTGLLYLVDSQESATCGDMIQFKKASFWWKPFTGSWRRCGFTVALGLLQMLLGCKERKQMPVDGKSEINDSQGCIKNWIPISMSILSIQVLCSGSVWNCFCDRYTTLKWEFVWNCFCYLYTTLKWEFNSLKEAERNEDSIPIVWVF